ncbi:MAG: hypothetical protein QM752_00290 [Gammaproteobacteria bacterium]
MNNLDYLVKDVIQNHHRSQNYEYDSPASCSISGLNKQLAALQVYMGGHVSAFTEAGILEFSIAICGDDVNGYHC